MAELTFLKELTLIRWANQKSATFVTIIIFLNKGLKFQPNVCSGCHDLLIMPIYLNDIAILNTKGSDHGCIVSRISSLLQNINLSIKSET